MRRRNETFQLTSPKPSAPIVRPTIAGLTTLGIVANPKTREPLLVLTDGTWVSIRSLAAKTEIVKIGVGYYETGSGKYAESAEFTGYPRAHTADGVTVKGKGYGTALYTALALGAALTDDEAVEIDMYKNNQGISSWTDNRSTSADDWWKAANKRKLTATEVEEIEEKEENVDIDLDADDLNKVASVDGTITYVNTVNVDIEKTEERTYDVYLWGSAVDHNLIVCEFVVEVPDGADLGWLFDILIDKDDEATVLRVDPIALAALDVRELSEEGAKLIGLQYLEAKLGEKALDEFWQRYQQRLDPSMSGSQLRLFNANSSSAGLEMVDAARQESRWSDLEDLP